MTSYAALLSLFHTLNNIKIHPRPPISLDPQQLQSLTQNLTFFQEFLERYPTQEDYYLESRIADAVYAAEDVIETHIVDQIHDRANIFSQGRWKLTDTVKKSVKKIMGAQKVDQPDSGSTSHGLNIHPGYLYQDLGRVIGDMDLIKREVMEIIKDKIMTPQHHPHLHTKFSGVPASTWQSSAMPVFDDAIITDVLDKLTGQQSSLQIIPIVGMGGIGKTTFARYIYSNSLIVGHFDIRVWVTISQEYSVPEILAQVLGEGKGNRESELNENELGEEVHKMLFRRRYLIVMDDMWNNEALDKVRRFFPDYNDGSRIMITTRLSNLAFELSDSHVFPMKFLDEVKSWGLLCETVFDKESGCPIELEKIGKEIARKCRGLPLSIVVVGGLLKKSNMTRAYWMHTLKNLNLIINLENDEYVLQILRTSYKELPMHLKPCFLYMGIFPEDKKIRTSVLVKLWVAEGILKPMDDKSLEEVAKEYLKELIERNLILISELRWNGKAKLCKMHDLLRDVCLREAQKQKLFCVVRQQKHHIPQGLFMERRICIHPENKYSAYSPKFIHAVEAASLTRSLHYTMPIHQDIEYALPSLRFRLLRVYSSVESVEADVQDSNNAIFEQANLRYLILYNPKHPLRFLSLFSLLWNLQTLEVSYPYSLKRAFKIWKMPLLRHFITFGFVLPNPSDGEDNFVLENLQTLSSIRNLKFSEEVVKRIPNIKKLKLTYGRVGVLLPGRVFTDYRLINLGRLEKIESLSLEYYKIRSNLVSFPQSLKKLSLCGTGLSWEEFTTMIGSLPLLQFLDLFGDACRGSKWETVEGQFCSLRFLRIAFCDDLKYWETDSAHFPRLEHLHLRGLKNLEKIPLSIGDISTLKSIQLDDRHRYAESARRIIEEQRENGNEDLELRIEDDYGWDELVRQHEEEEKNRVDPEEEDQVDSEEED